jgi:sec-independent protein translocase protein TatA
VIDKEVVMPTLGPFELLIILAIIIAIFGASRLAGVGGALGKSVRDFRSSVREDEPSALPKPAARDDT